VIEHAREKGVKLNPDKCKIGVQEQHSFGPNQVWSYTRPAKVQAISEICSPNTRPKLETFLGMVIYLAKFAPNLADTTAPLRSLLRKDVKFFWEKQPDRAFQKVKHMISEAGVLADPKALLI
jgi:hypothetical protein